MEQSISNAAFTIVFPGGDFLSDLPETVRQKRSGPNSLRL